MTKNPLPIAATIDQIRALAQQQTIYVRWSKDIDLDNRRGYSLRFGKQAEAGLSACRIDPDWDDWRIIRQIQEYSYLGGQCWIITGHDIGRGGDNEPLLRDVVALAMVADTITMADWLGMWRDAELARTEHLIEVLTDDIAIGIYRDKASKLGGNDRNVWDNMLWSV